MMLNQGIRGLPLYRAMFYLPSLLGASVAIAVLWRQLFAGDGLVNQAAGARSASAARAGSPIPTTALYTLVALSRLAVRLADDHLPRRAAADPAGCLRGRASSTAPRKARQFFKITLPLLTPVIFFNAVVQTIDAFKAFTPAFIISERHRRPGRLDAVLHALSLPGGVRLFPHGLRLGARLDSRRHHRHLHRLLVPVVALLGALR